MSCACIEILNSRDNLLNFGQLPGSEVAVIQEGSELDIWDFFPQDSEKCGNVEICRNNAQRASLADAIGPGNDSSKGTCNFNVSL